MASRGKHGRTRDVAPVSFRVSAPVRASAEAIAAAGKVTVNELARECLEERVLGVTRRTGSGAGDSERTADRKG